MVIFTAYTIQFWAYGPCRKQKETTYLQAKWSQDLFFLHLYIIFFRKYSNKLFDKTTCKVYWIRKTLNTQPFWRQVGKYIKLTQVMQLDISLQTSDSSTIWSSFQQITDATWFDGACWVERLLLGFLKPVALYHVWKLISLPLIINKWINFYKVLLQWFCLGKVPKATPVLWNTK